MKLCSSFSCNFFKIIPLSCEEKEKSLEVNEISTWNNINKHLNVGLHRIVTIPFSSDKIICNILQVLELKRG